MFRRRKTEPAPEGPVVCDRRGRPVGVRTEAPAQADEPPPVRQERMLQALRRTSGLERQAALRCTVSLFCADPPRGMGYR